MVALKLTPPGACCSASRPQRGGDRGEDGHASAYSREVEAAADDDGVELMAKIGGGVRAFAAIFHPLAGAIEPRVNILLDHPQTEDRVAAINTAAGALQGELGPLLGAPEWAALTRMCG